MDRVSRPEFLAPSGLQVPIGRVRLPSVGFSFDVHYPSFQAIAIMHTVGAPHVRPTYIIHEPPGVPQTMPKHPAQSDHPRPSGLAPAVLLGLLGLPLIIEAGPASDLPEWAYGSGLIMTVALGLITTMRTCRMERFAALVATVLLAALCLIQLTVVRFRYDVAQRHMTARYARPPKDAIQKQKQVEKTTRTTYEENHD